MFNVDNFWQGFSDEIEKIAAGFSYPAAAMSRKMRQMKPGRIPTPKMAKPSVPASVGPTSATAGVSKPPAATPVPKKTGASSVAKPAPRTLLGDIKSVGSSAASMGGQMLPFVAMSKMQGGGKPKPSNVYV